MVHEFMLKVVKIQNKNKINILQYSLVLPLQTNGNTTRNTLAFKPALNSTKSSIITGQQLLIWKLTNKLE